MDKNHINSGHTFRLVEQCLNWYVIVKFAEDTKELPIHGFIHVIYDKGYVALVDEDRISEELSQSGELEELKKEAISLTK